MTGPRQSVILSFLPHITSHELSELAAGPPTMDKLYFSAQAKCFKAFVNSVLLTL